MAQSISELECILAEVLFTYAPTPHFRWADWHSWAFLHTRDFFLARQEHLIVLPPFPTIVPVAFNQFF
jgi:hypothetical protein